MGLETGVEPGSEPPAIRGFASAAHWAGLGAALIGTIALFGWSFGASLYPSLISTKPNTALCFVLLGTALAFARGPGPRELRARRAASSAVALIAGLTLLQTIFEFQAGIEQLLFEDPAPGRTPGRMSPVTASHFLLLGAASWWLGSGLWFGWRPSEILALVTAFSALVSILGQVYGTPVLYARGPYTTTALHTSIAFVSCSVAILCARGDHAFVRLFGSSGPEGMLMRRFIPAAILLPFVIGWLRLLGQRAGLYTTEFGTAIFAAANILCFAILGGWTARVVEHASGVKRSAQNRLRENEQSLATTLDSIGDAVIATDKQGRVVRMNPVAEALTGYSKAEARGKELASILRIVSETTREPVENPVDQVLRNGRVVGLANHTLLIARDGSERAIADSGAPIRGANGSIEGVVLVFRDQTAEREAERALRRNEARKTAIFEAALDAVVTMDHTGKITGFNAAAEQMFGYPRQHAIGRPLAELLIPERLRDRHRAALGRYVASGRSTILGQRLELPALRADGSEISVELGVVRVPSDGPPEFTGYIRDLSKLKHAEAAHQTEATARSRAEQALRRTEEQLHQSQKLEAIGRLAGGVAHDFNNMLSVILGCADMLLDALPEPDPKRAEVTEILTAANRAADLTRQLLAFSRQQVLEPRVLDLNQLLQNLDRMLARVIGANIELTIVPGQGLGLVRVDPNQIELVIMNLVVNARDAMPSGGKLTIETSRVGFGPYRDDPSGASGGPHVVLSVSDTGVGMDPETQARIFEPFFTTKPKDKGTGLGLAMVFGTVTQSGGSVDVASQPGKGTTFRLYFPVSEQDAPTAVAKVPGTARSDGSESILLVEDQEHVRRVCSAILRRSGYQVIEAKDAEEALQIAEPPERRIDLLLTDVMMPGMSGPVLAQRLASLRPGLRLICMSGYADDAVHDFGASNADIAFLQKPITPESLVRKVREVLDSR